MENRQGYDPSEFEDDDYTTPQPDAGKSIRGYRIVIIILSVILVAISVLYFSIHRQQMLDNELLQADRRLAHDAPQERALVEPRENQTI